MNENFFEEPITERTAYNYLRRLGFKYMKYKKGIYVDGHERDDVRIYREEYLRLKKIHDAHCVRTMPTPEQIKEYMARPKNKRPYVEIVHDESCCNANDDQSSEWVPIGGSPKLKKKSLGKGIMVSLFLTEICGPLRDPDTKKLCVRYLEYGKGKWWRSANMVEHTRDAIRIAEKLFPWAQLIFRFDNSSNHKKFASDALNVQKMNVNSGGKQPVMHPTWFVGADGLEYQSMVTEEGEPKGLQMVLEERGVCCDGFTLNHENPNMNYRTVLASFPDFVSETTILESLIQEKGHLIIYYPKFHLEFAPIEQLWGE